MKAVVTGSGGQLASCVRDAAPTDVEVVTLTRRELDITDAAAVDATLEQLAPDLIFNCAAYTDVDRAESEPQAAFAANADGPANLAQAAARIGARLVHVSTDFVFDGSASTPYAPEAHAAPLNVYGASKLAGERKILDGASDALIVRTAWLYAMEFRNFVTTMLMLMNERSEIQVVADKVGTPTHGRTLASGLWQLAAQGARGIYHLTDAGVASRYDFAQAIKEEARQAGLVATDPAIIPISSSEFPTTAKRPSYSVLDNGRTWAELGWRPRHWRTELRNALQGYHG